MRLPRCVGGVGDRRPTTTHFTPNKTFPEFRELMNGHAAARGASRWQMPAYWLSQLMPLLFRNLSGFGSVYSRTGPAPSHISEPARFVEGLESPIGRSLTITET